MFEGYGLDIRLPKKSFIWIFVASLWAPLAWFIPIISLSSGEIYYGPAINGMLVIPMLILWFFTGVVHFSLWVAFRCIDLWVIPFGLLTIGLPMLIIGFLSLNEATCRSDGTPYSFCPDFKGTGSDMWWLGFSMMLLTLPTWIVSGIASFIRLNK